MNTNKHRNLLETKPPEQIVEALQPFILERRLQRIEDVIHSRLSSIQLAIESPSDINNAFAAIRSCEALGVSTIHIIAPEGDASSIRSITQGAFYWTNILFHEDLEAFISHLQQHKILLAGGIMSGDHKLSDVPVNNPICFMIGNEQRGLSQSAQSNCDYLYRIEMFGMSESMNLSVCAAISMYDATLRKRDLLQQPSDLTSDQQMQIRAKFYLNSVSARLADGLLLAE